MYVMEEDQDTQAHTVDQPITEIPEQLQGEIAGDTTDTPSVIHHYTLYLVKDDDPQTNPPIVDEAPPQQPEPIKQKRLPILLLVGILICVLAASSGIVAGLIWFTPPVTITVIPEQQSITTTSTVTLVEEKPKTADQIPARKLSTVTMSQQQTVTSTGTGHQPAQAATGAVTLFNAAPYSQTIDAGTLIIAGSGIQIATNYAVVIPPANLPLTGSVTVTAHAVEPGPEGNIPADAVNTACCKVNVFARNNQAFTGGQNERTYPMVTQHDLAIADTLKTQLVESIQTAAQTQVKPTETLVTPLSCTPTVKPDHAVDSEAIQVTVTVSETCTPVVYNTQALQAHIEQMQTQESTKQLGSGYGLIGSTPIQTTITKVTTAVQGLLTLMVEGQGTWAYQFDQTQLQQISHQLAGKSREKATTLLLQLPGVKQVSLGDTPMLPNDPGKIRIVVFYGAM